MKLSDVFEDAAIILGASTGAAILSPYPMAAALVGPAAALCFAVAHALQKAGK